MHVIRFFRIWALFSGLILVSGVAHAQKCSGLPTSFSGNEFPKGDFFTNFNNGCYAIHLGKGTGTVEYGDPSATYYQLYFKVDPRYQLILVGNYPNARYFSVSLNDVHEALSQSILDVNIAPLTSQYANPYLPGVAYVAGQQYAVPVNFGGTPGNLETGCMMNGYNVTGNSLDGTQRHPGMDWNSDSGVFTQYPTFATHIVDTPEHTNPNTAGLIMVRAYIDDSAQDSTTTPTVIVRDVASGCAYPGDYALNTLKIVTTTNTNGLPWMDNSQISGHHVYETSYLPKLCNAPAPPTNSLKWARQPAFVPISNPDASYIVANVPSGLPAVLASGGEVMRIRMRVPITPPTPCTNGCSRSGNEQMRYMSLTFSDPGGAAMVSVTDNEFTRDPQGYATLIVGTGAAIPSWITPENGYTYLDLTQQAGYAQLSLLTLRHIIPSPAFNCAGQYVPYRTSVDTALGSLMGDYEPVVDYPIATNLPQKTTPLIGLNACGLFPAGLAGNRPKCNLLPEPVPAISAAVTQCPVPGCDQFAAQPNPPIAIVGKGFGTFPQGAPFTGTSRYLAIRDITQAWIAGFQGASCTVSISEWDDNRIQLVANVNADGQCRLTSGDKLKIGVWNPETLLPVTFDVKVQ